MVNGGQGRRRGGRPGRRRHPGAGRRAVDRGHGRRSSPKARADAVHRARTPGGPARPGRRTSSLGHVQRITERRPDDLCRLATRKFADGAATAGADRARDPGAHRSTSRWSFGIGMQRYGRAWPSSSWSTPRTGSAPSRCNRPEARNALSVALQREAGAALAAADADPDVDVVILTGTDPAFCAGLDLRELGHGRVRTSSAAPTIPRSARSPRSWKMTKPVIGAINGPCVTGGFELALACDFLVASERAAFADTHARVGVMPAGGMSVFLPAGRRRAQGEGDEPERQLHGCARGVRARAREPRRRRTTTLLPAARKLAADIVGNDQAAVRNLKRLYDANEKVTVGEAIEQEQAVLPRLAHRSGRDRAAARAGIVGAGAGPAVNRGERFETHMSDSDALMWNIEKDPLLRSTIVTVLLLDRAPGLGPARRADRARDVADPAHAPARRDAAAAHRPAAVVGRRELRPRATTCAGCEACEPTIDAVLDLARTAAMAGFDRARPLWEYTVVEGLEGGQSAMILKVHHSMTDGVGGMKLLLMLFDFEREPEPACHRSTGSTRCRSSGRWTSCWSALGHNQRRGARASPARGRGRVGRRRRAPSLGRPGPHGPACAAGRRLGRPLPHAGDRPALPDHAGPDAGAAARARSTSRSTT